jgi:hypothetical protein
VQARTETSVQQNEYSTWVVKDRHARAFAILSNDVARRIARIMDLKPADQEPRCLGCHALNVPEAQRARTFDATDGVSCESCHGPASNWLGKHTEKGWTHEQSVSVGMKDLRDPAHRAENCLRCHLGDEDNSVDHELIAAGHPDLVFELAAFTAAMPKHWKEAGEKPNTQAPDPWYDVRALTTGEAVELQQQLLRVARNTQTTMWPQYGDLDCFACHHSLTSAENSWQQQRGYPPLPELNSNTGTLPAPGAGRRPGNPPWNISRYVALREVAGEIDPDNARELQGNIDRLYGMISSLGTDKGQIEALATSTAALAGRMVPKMTAATYDQPRTLRMMKAIVNNADFITAQGERPAEQAAMVLRVLYTTYAANGKPAGDAQIQDAIMAMFSSVDNPSAYNAFKFADLMKALNRVLP